MWRVGTATVLFRDPEIKTLFQGHVVITCIQVHVDVDNAYNVLINPPTQITDTDYCVYYLSSFWHYPMGLVHSCVCKGHGLCLYQSLRGLDCITKRTGSFHSSYSSSLMAPSHQHMEVVNWVCYSMVRECWLVSQQLSSGAWALLYLPPSVSLMDVAPG